MIRKSKILSPLAFAALFILGTTTTASSDSLPGLAAQASLTNATCISRSSAGDNAIYNNCGTAINVWVPMQSRATGNFKFYAAAPASDFTSCTVYGRDFNNGAVFSGGPTALSGNTQIGSTAFAAGATTTVYYQCNLYNGGRLQSVNSIQQ